MRIERNRAMFRHGGFGKREVDGALSVRLGTTELINARALRAHEGVTIPKRQRRLNADLLVDGVGDFVAPALQGFGVFAFDEQAGFRFGAGIAQEDAAAVAF